MDARDKRGHDDAKYFNMNRSRSKFSRVLVKFIGTHAEYDQFDPETVSMAKKMIRPLRSEADYETTGYTQADLGRLLGSRQRASDILTRKRTLTMQMAWKLHREWGIPAEALIMPPRARRPTFAA